MELLAKIVDGFHENGSQNFSKDNKQRVELNGQISSWHSVNVWMPKGLI